MKLMKICILLTAIIQTAIADCNFSKDVIVKDGYVAYSYDCHKYVGKLVEDIEDREDQVKYLKKSIEMKDLAIDLSEQRTDLWKEEAKNQHKIIQSYSNTNKYENAYWFAGGIGLTILSVWAVGQLNN